MQSNARTMEFQTRTLEHSCKTHGVVTPVNSTNVTMNTSNRENNLKQM